MEREPSLPWWSVLALPLFGQVVAIVAMALAGGAAPGPLHLAAIQAAAFGGATALGLVWFRRGMPLKGALLLHPVPIPVILLAALAGVGLQFWLSEVNNLIQEVFPEPLEVQLLRQQLVSPSDALGVLLVFVALVLVAPATEELLFRGLLLPGLAARYGPSRALVSTALVFGILHQSPSATAYAFIAGLLLGFVVLRTGSVIPALAMHAAANGVPLLLPERLVRIEGFNTVGEGVYHLPLPLLGAALVVTTLALWGLFRLAPPTHALPLPGPANTS